MGIIENELLPFRACLNLPLVKKKDGTMILDGTIMSRNESKAMKKRKPELKLDFLLFSFKRLVSSLMFMRAAFQVNIEACN